MIRLFEGRFLFWLRPQAALGLYKCSLPESTLPMGAMHETCDNYVVVAHNGDIYPCELFVITFLRVRGDRQHPSTASEKGTGEHVS
jgi:sulfatase maturation enzyme AslB (radical SAM superfamily)